MTIKLVFILFYLFSGLIPQLVLIYEFKTYGWKFIKLYCHLYIFPFLVLPFILFFLNRVTSYVINLQVLVDNIYYYGIILFLFPLIGAILDVAFGDPALFGFKPDILIQRKNNKKGSSMIEIFNKILEITKEIDDIKDEIKQQLASNEKINTLNNLLAKRKKFQKIFHESLNKNRNFKNISISTYFYAISIFILFSILITAFLCLIILIKSLPDVKGTEYKDILQALTIVTLFLSFWLPMRIYFLHEKKNIYIKVTMIGELPLAILFIGSYFYLVGVFFNIYNHYIFNVIGIIIALAGPIIAYISPRHMSKVFGLESSPASFIGIFLVLILLILPFL